MIGAASIPPEKAEIHGRSSECPWTGQFAGPVNLVDPRQMGTRDKSGTLKISALASPPQNLHPSPATAAGVTDRNALRHTALRDRHCDARCKAYRSGLRRALAEVTIQRVYGQQRRSEMTGRRMDDSRLGKVTAFKNAAHRINRLMLEPCPFHHDCPKEG